MPEQPPKTNKLIWLLSLAAAHGQLVWVECGYCRGRRYYEAGDLMQVFGNADVNKLARRMRCERCGRNDNMECDVVLPPAAERQEMSIRRLVEIRLRRTPIWRDVKG